MVNTNLTAWSWSSSRSQVGHDGTAQAPDIDTNVIVNEKPSNHVVLTDPDSPNSDLFSDAQDKCETSSSRSEGDSDNPQPDDSLNQRRRSTSSSEVRAPAGVPFKTSPSPYSPSSSGICKATRKELLGNRKHSDLPTEEDHLSFHRDSLVLSHERLHPRNARSKKQTETYTNQRAHTKDEPHPMPTIRYHESYPTSTQQFAPLQASMYTDNTPSGSAGSAITETRPINALAKKVRTPARKSSQGHDKSQSGRWLYLTDEFRPCTDNDAAKRHAMAPAAISYSGAANAEASEALYLKLSPDHHRPAAKSFARQG